MRYILFGTGDCYKRFRHWFENRDVAAILDNDVNKQGSMMDGHPIVSPDNLRQYEYDAVVILSFYVTEMKKQLINIGVAEEKIFHFYDLHELFAMDHTGNGPAGRGAESVLLLSHDLSEGGPALALFHAALSLKKTGYETVYASMLDGALRSRLEDAFIPVVIDERLQIGTMRELGWTSRYDLIICNTINYHVFLSERDKSIPVIWWLHDSPFFYEGIKPERLKKMDTENLKYLSVGPVPRKAMQRYKPESRMEDLIYGVSDGI